MAFLIIQQRLKNGLDACTALQLSAYACRGQRANVTKRRKRTYLNNTHRTNFKMIKVGSWLLGQLLVFCG